MINQSSILKKWGQLSSSQQSKVLNALSQNHLSGIPQIDQYLLNNSSSDILNILGQQTGGRQLTPAEIQLRDEGKLTPQQVAKILNEPVTKTTAPTQTVTRTTAPTQTVTRTTAPTQNTMELIRQLTEKMNLLKTQKSSIEKQMSDCDNKLKELTTKFGQSEQQNKDLRTQMETMSKSTGSFEKERSAINEALRKLLAE